MTQGLALVATVTVREPPTDEPRKTVEPLGRETDMMALSEMKKAARWRPDGVPETGG
jgi:hypothetical protein